MPGRSEKEIIGELFGFPITGKDRTELNLLHPDGKMRVSEMRVADTQWECPAYIASVYLKSRGRYH
ncbi:MAG: hypothetical protein MI799_02615 [Desulfobacterales bacterium]|nr:hypothetical protein [Desulfobacterales bacterium]